MALVKRLNLDGQMKLYPGSPLVAHGVIHYAMQALGLCAGMSGARYTTTTEVYPDSPRATPEQCIAAQVAAVCAGVEFVG